MGGYQPSLNYFMMKSIFTYIDCLIIGEGEHTMLSIIKNLHDESWKNICGIAYFENNEIIYTGNAMLIQDLDLFPYPKRVKYNKEMNIITNRGCYGNCSFCCSSAFKKVCDGKYARRRSPENVVDEIYIN